MTVVPVAFILQALGSDDLAFLHGGVSFPLCKLKKVLRAHAAVSIYGTQRPRGVWFGFPSLPRQRASDFFCSTRLLPENHTQPAKRLAGACSMRQT